MKPPAVWLVPAREQGHTHTARNAAAEYTPCGERPGASVLGLVPSSANREMEDEQCGRARGHHGLRAGWRWISVHGRGEKVFRGSLALSIRQK